MLDRLRDFFIGQGCSAFLVGGYLRDTLLSVAPERDVDIAVAADVGRVGPELARFLGGTYVPLGTPYRVVRVVAPDPDGGQEGPWTIDLREFFGDIEEDLAARDFSLNALALSLDAIPESGPTPALGELVIDPFHGRLDMSHKSIRAIGPNVFRDDPGRLLRGVRLAARLRFRLDPDTARMIAADAPLIPRVAGDRVRSEFLDLLALDGAKGHLEVLDRLDLLCRILPELEAAKGVDQPKEHYWDVWGHLIHCVEAAELVTKGHQNSPVYSFVPWAEERESYFGQQISDGHTRRTLLKLGALLHDVAKPQTKSVDETGRTRFLGHPELGAEMTEARLTQLRFSSKGMAAVAEMVRQHMRPATMHQGIEFPTNRAIYRYFRDVGDVAVDTLYLWMADHLAARGPELVLDAWAAHARMVTYILQVGTQPPVSQQKVRLVTGHDLMQRFHLEPGPVIGRLLEQVQEAHAAGEIGSREDAMALVKAALNRDGKGVGG